MEKNKLIGTWKLISFEAKAQDGQVNYPFGKDASGYLTYTDENFMSVLLMQPGRPEFTSGDPLNATTSEKTAAFDGFVSYCGNFSVENDKVIHHITLSSFPNWVNTKQERFFKFEGDNLILSTPVFLLEGKQQSSYLIWKKT